jgi:predicted HTH transcriptional regulator
MLSNGVKTTNKQSVALFSSLLSYSRVSNIQKRRDFLNCYQEDPETKQNGVTLAGVMLFAPDLLILKVCPAHRTDLILRKVNVDRYDDRDLVHTNLIESYDLR